MKLINPAHEEEVKRPLKNSKTGMEIEYHVINKNGFISQEAQRIITSLKEAGDKHVTKEVGKNMIEFGCYPGVETYNPALDIINSIQTAAEIADKNDLLLYPFGTYPGEFSSEFSEGKRYQIQEKIFGTRRMKIAYEAVGFHHHYSFPKGVFDAEHKQLKLLRRSKLSRVMIACYNFEIAADPALTLFTQSSPFRQGKILAKDSRMVIYRGGKKLHFVDGLYGNHQQLGGLPPYKQTVTDLLTSLRKRWQRWELEIKKVDPQAKMEELYPYKMDIAWNPVKLNKHGTFEQRGMDANYPSILVAVTALLKSCLQHIQEHFVEVLPADFAVEEAFKEENGILYIPPHTFVRNQYQKLSAYEGFSNEEMYKYAKRFFDFAYSVTDKNYAPIVKPLKEMLEKKRSMSDSILQYAKRKGYVQDNSISNEDAAELALHYTKKLPKDLELTKKKLEKVSGV